MKEIKVYYDSSCVVCGEKAPGKKIGSVREHEYLESTDMEFPVYRCENCGLVYLYPRPDVSELNVIYPKTYYSYNIIMNAPDKNEKKSFVQKLWFKIQNRGYKKRIVKYLKSIPSDRPLRVLDIGCGVGHQLDNVKSLLPDCETYGIEIQEIAAEKAKKRGHTVYLGRFEDIDLPKNYFDVIFSIHVIEHVARPDLFMKKSLDILTDNGVVMYETPNTDCLDFYFLKRKHWGGYHPPRHWYLFNIKPFRKLAERFNAEIYGYGAYTMSNFWSWSFHSLFLRIFGRKIADFLFPPVKILYGGLQSFIILSYFAVLERILLFFTGKANSLWVTFGKSK